MIITLGIVREKVLHPFDRMCFKPLPLLLYLIGRERGINGSGVQYGGFDLLPFF